MRFFTLIAAGALALGACRPLNAAPPYAPYPDIIPGTVYHFIAYQADGAGKLQKKGNATVTVEKPVEMGGSEYVRITRKVAGKDFGEERYRFTDALLLLEDPNNEASVRRIFDSPPKIGAEIRNGDMVTKVVTEKDPAIEGATYKNLIVVEYYTAGTLRLRYVIDRDAGHVKSTIYNASGKLFGELRRDPQSGQ